MPSVETGYQHTEARLFRYAYFKAYRDNTMYTDLVSWTLQQKIDGRLDKFIKPFFNPVSRQNDLIAAGVYGGTLDLEHMTGGAVPIVTDNPAVINALRQLFIWSRWGENKNLYVRQAALLGDVGLKIVDDREHQKVFIEVLDPGKIRDAKFDDAGNVKAAIIEYEREEEPDPTKMNPSRIFTQPETRLRKTYVYTEKITGPDTDPRGPGYPGQFQTFKNGEPFAFYNDAEGNPIDHWDNECGFVPLIIAKYKEIGLDWGANSFYNALSKIDGINNLASQINQQVRKSVNLIWYFAGVTKESEIDAGVDKPDKVPALYGPEGSQPFPMIGNLPIADALAVLNDMQEELKKDLPELALQEMRDKGGNFTAPGVRAIYSDAVGRIEEAQGNLDHAAIRAFQMAMTIGGMNNYQNFLGFGPDSYDRGDMDFYIKPRPVISDDLSLKEKLDVLQANGAPIWLVLEEMGYPQETIDKVVADKEAETRNAVRGFAQGLFGDNSNGGDQTPPALPSGTKQQAPPALPPGTPNANQA